MSATPIEDHNYRMEGNAQPKLLEELVRKRAYLCRLDLCDVSSVYECCNEWYIVFYIISIINAPLFLECSDDTEGYQRTIHNLLTSK